MNESHPAISSSGAGSGRPLVAHLATCRRVSLSFCVYCATCPVSAALPIDSPLPLHPATCAVCARQGVQGLPQRQLSHPVQLRRLRPRRRLPRCHPRAAGGPLLCCGWGKGVDTHRLGFRQLPSLHAGFCSHPVAAAPPPHPTHPPTCPPTHSPSHPHPRPLPRRSASPAAASSTSTGWGVPRARGAPAVACCCSCPRSSTSCASSRVGGKLEMFTCSVVFVVGVGSGRCLRQFKGRWQC